MAGRIRTLKPELLEDAITAGLSHEAFRLFVAAILLADDWGNLNADAALLHAKVFSRRPLARGVEDLDVLLGELTQPKGSEPGLVEVYCVRGQRFITLSGWFHHQKIDHPTAPKVPTPLESELLELRRRYRARAKSRLPISEKDMERGGRLLREFVVVLSRQRRAGSGSGSGSGHGRGSDRARPGAPATNPPRPPARTEKTKSNIAAAQAWLESEKRGSR